MGRESRGHKEGIVSISRWSTRSYVHRVLSYSCCLCERHDRCNCTFYTSRDLLQLWRYFSFLWL